MIKPVVAIASNFEILDNTEKITLNMAYSNAIELAGGIPLIISMTDDKTDIERMLKLCSGLLVPGGSDISPLLFGKEPVPGMGIVRPNLDIFQISATSIAIERKMPFLGICRGCQVLNVALGGDLIQHITLQEDSVKHQQEARRKYPTHTVDAIPESMIGELLGESFCVNSFHHQAIATPGKGLAITARARDGIAETIELEGSPFTVGVQWHPEALLEEEDKSMLPLFKAFIDHCSRFK